MSNPVTIETDLKDILAKIDSRLDRMEQKLETLPRIEARLDGLDKRVENLENRVNG